MMEIDSVVTDRQWAEEWSDQLENLLVEVGELFPRVEVRRRAADFVRGLLGPIPRTNGWHLLETAQRAASFRVPRRRRSAHSSRAT
ncbi:hypothetical protein AB0K60_17420 [Thermopolyspora sp. NPDC052614]|uniref:hypothetical protein n=1 Tax=Thermopolyspora sp. NPDC052614 TaxID=3155682 RepID=UPI003412A75F